jgi:hypothetical protein
MRCGRQILAPSFVETSALVGEHGHRVERDRGIRIDSTADKFYRVILVCGICNAVVGARQIVTRIRWCPLWTSGRK